MLALEVITRYCFSLLMESQRSSHIEQDLSCYYNCKSLKWWFNSLNQVGGLEGLGGKKKKKKKSAKGGLAKTKDLSEPPSLSETKEHTSWQKERKLWHAPLEGSSSLFFLQLNQKASTSWNIAKGAMMFKLLRVYCKISPSCIKSSLMAQKWNHVLLF